MATSTRWGGFRPDPYNPNAVDADNDGIVQEGTLFERPAGTRFVNIDGTEIRQMLRGDNLTALNGIKLVDADGNDVPYEQSWRAGNLSIGQRIGTIDSTGMPTVGQMVGVAPPRSAPKMAAPKVSPQDIVIPEKYGGSRGLSELREEFPELFDREGNLRTPFRPRFQPHGFAGGANDLLRGAKTWGEVRDRLKGKTIIAYDYETTDFVDNGGRAVQIGAVKIVDGEVVDRFNVYIDPGVPFDEWSKFSRDNLKWRDGSLITPEKITEFGTSKQAHQEFIDWIGDDEFYMMGHNAFSFDDKLLEIESNLNGIDQPNAAGRIDTWSLAADINSELGPDAITRSNSLPNLTEALGIDLGEKAHTADADSEATGKLLFALIDAAEDRDVTPDIVDPDVSLRREEERRAKYDADMEKYERAFSVYNEIMDETKRRKALSAARRRDDESRDRSPLPDQASQAIDEEDILNPEDVEDVSLVVDDLVTQLIEGKITFVEEKDSELITDINGSPYTIDIDENDQLLGPTPEGLQAVEAVQQVGRSVRARANELMNRRYKKEVTEHRRRVEEGLREISRYEKEKEEINKKISEYINNFSINLFGTAPDNLTQSQLRTLNDRLAVDRDFDRLPSPTQQEMEIRRIQDTVIKPSKLSLRKMYASALLETIHGEDGFDQGRRDSMLETSTEFSANIRSDSVPAKHRERIETAAKGAWDALPESVRQIISEQTGTSDGSTRIKLVTIKDDIAGGHFRGYVDDDGAVVMEIAVSETTVDGSSDDHLQSVVFHEMIHALQFSSPEFFALEQAFAAKRTRGASVDSWEIGPTDEPIYKDEFSDPYSGLILENSEGFSRFWEVSTSSLDGVFFPNDNDDDVPDDDQVDFALGALLSIRKNRKGIDLLETEQTSRYGRDDPDRSTEELVEVVRSSREPNALDAEGIDPLLPDVDIPRGSEGIDLDSPEEIQRFNNSVADLVAIDAEFEGLDYHLDDPDTFATFTLVEDTFSTTAFNARKRITDRGEKLFADLRNRGKVARRRFSARSDKAANDAIPKNVRDEMREKYVEALNTYHEGYTNTRIALINMEIEEIAKEIFPNNPKRARKLEDTIIKALTDGQVVDRSNIPPPFGATEEILREQSDEMGVLMYTLILAELDKKTRFGGNKSRLSSNDKLKVVNRLNRINEKIHDHNVRTYIHNEGAEWETAERVKDALITPDGRDYLSTIKEARRSAAVAFFKEIDPDFGTGTLRVDTSGLEGTLDKEQIDLLMRLLGESLPKEWVDVVNTAGYRFTISERGHQVSPKPPRIDADGNRLIPELGTISGSRSIPFAKGVSKEAEVYDLLDVFIHEIGHAASDEYAERPVGVPSLSSRFQGQRARTEIAMLIVNRQGRNNTPKQFDSLNPDEISYISDEEAPYALKYLTKHYPASSNGRPNPTEVYSMAADTFFMGSSYDEFDDHDPEMQDALFGALLAGLGGRSDPIQDSEYALILDSEDDSEIVPISVDIEPSQPAPRMS